MRLFVLSLSLLASAAANAYQMDVSIVHGSAAPVKFSYPVNEIRQHADLRVSNEYMAAFTDPHTKKDICRAGMYQTGMLLTLEPKGAVSEDGLVPVEIVGQLSTLKEIKKGKTLACGTQEDVSLANKAFSDTVNLKLNKTKVVVIDTAWTVLVTLKP